MKHCRYGDNTLTVYALEIQVYIYSVAEGD